MEHRNPRAFPTADDASAPPPAQASSRRPDGASWTQRVARGPVRLRVRRVGPVVALALGLVALAGWGQVRRWLYARDEYRIPFEAIELEPLPPPWIKGGRPAILQEVREGAGLPATIGVLDADATAIRKALPYHSPWIREAMRIRRVRPNRLVAEVEYREPLAEVRFGPKPKPGDASRPVAVMDSRPSAVVDAEGVVLPRDRLLLDHSPRLIGIETFRTPAALRPGLSVQVADPAGVSRPDADLVRCCRLAEFLKARGAAVAAIGPPTQVDLLAGGIFVWFPGPRLTIWSELDRPDRGDEPPDEEKWDALVRWADAHDWPEDRDGRRSVLTFDAGRWNLKPVAPTPP